MVTKALYILPDIHRQQCQTCKVPSTSLGTAGVRCHAHGHFDTWSGGTEDWTTNLPVRRQPTWTTEPLPPTRMLNWVWFDLAL